MDRTLLLVDDEPHLLSSLMRLLRRDGYRLITASGATEGLAVLEREPVQVIVSDQRMPEMTGVEFLRRVKERFPDTVRIVLSGYSEISSITEAINQGAIYKFFTKPWDDEQLRANIAEAFRHAELEHENKCLARDLKAANEELAQINQNLERRVEEKSREILLNLQVLQISQEVLEHLPVAVLGVGSDGLIAVANRKAHELLERSEGALIGQEAAQWLPPGAFSGGSTNGTAISFDTAGGRTLEVRAQPLHASSHAHGTIVVLTPRAPH
jgi:response regulator RpfG family c-di-GMP phosphodiesterase